jgi:Fic family protein
MSNTVPTGTYITTTAVSGERVRAFVPAPLPIITPPLDMTTLQASLEKATVALGRLDGVTSALPNIDLLIYFYIRKEALLSSQIEGTQSSFDDLLLYESNAVPSVPVDDVEEVLHYVAAMNHGLTRMREGFPLSLRLIREMHAILMWGGRGSGKRPGEFRTSQNWVGGMRPGSAVFVPPPPEKVLECLGNLELYLHDHYGATPALLKAAIAHLQFETIHPFLDGNGRIGRLLITLLLCADGMLASPVLYLSLFFKKHRPVYYDLLDSVRARGDWTRWIDFFLEGVTETARDAGEKAQAIMQLFAADEAKIETLGRAKPSARSVFDHLKRKAICQIPTTAADLGLTQPTVTAALQHLQTLGIVVEESGKQRDRVFAYRGYVGLLKGD